MALWTVKKVSPRVIEVLDQMGKRANEWQMEFKSEESEVMVFRKLNQAKIYTVNVRDLGSVADQR